MNEIVTALVSLALDEASISVELLAEELSHISHDCFVEYVATKDALAVCAGVGLICERYIKRLESILVPPLRNGEELSTFSQLFLTRVRRR